MRPLGGGLITAIAQLGVAEPGLFRRRPEALLTLLGAVGLQGGVLSRRGRRRAGLDVAAHLRLQRREPPRLHRRRDAGSRRLRGGLGRLPPARGQLRAGTGQGGVRGRHDTGPAPHLRVRLRLQSGGRLGGDLRLARGGHH